MKFSLEQAKFIIVHLVEPWRAMPKQYHEPCMLHCSFVRICTFGMHGFLRMNFGMLFSLFYLLLSLTYVVLKRFWNSFFWGFVTAHTSPVLYERYEDEVDGFVYNVLWQLQHIYKKLNARVLRRIPTRNFRGRKDE